VNKTHHMCMELHSIARISNSAFQLFIKRFSSLHVKGYQRSDAPLVLLASIPIPQTETVAAKLHMLIHIPT